MGKRDSIEPVVRLFGADDSIGELTDLLHRGYRSLAERGLRFLATHQDEEETRRRIEGGECYLAMHDGCMIGTITWHEAKRSGGSPWYERPEVASFGQFAVEPAFWGRGVGSRLLQIVEARTIQSGAGELALDTAEPATDLIQFYGKRGYRFIEYAQWNVTNYRSVILSKRVG